MRLENNNDITSLSAQNMQLIDSAEFHPEISPVEWARIFNRTKITLKENSDGAYWLGFICLAAYTINPKGWQQSSSLAVKFDGLDIDIALMGYFHRTKSGYAKIAIAAALQVIYKSHQQVSFQNEIAEQIQLFETYKDNLSISELLAGYICIKILDPSYQGEIIAGFNVHKYLHESTFSDQLEILAWLKLLFPDIFATVDLAEFNMDDPLTLVDTIKDHNPSYLGICLLFAKIIHSPACTITSAGFIFDEVVALEPSPLPNQLELS